jgi:hypothetical protein
MNKDTDLEGFYKFLSIKEKSQIKNSGDYHFERSRKSHRP